MLVYFIQVRDPSDYRLTFRQPSGCKPEECTMFAAVDTNKGNSSYLDIYMSGKAQGWVAVGFTKAPHMVMQRSWFQDFFFPTLWQFSSLQKRQVARWTLPRIKVILELAVYSGLDNKNILREWLIITFIYRYTAIIKYDQHLSMLFCFTMQIAKFAAQRCTASELTANAHYCRIVAFETIGPPFAKIKISSKTN